MEEDIVIVDDNSIDIIEMQQNFYQLFGYKSHLIYDCYPSKVFVKQKIDILCPDVDERKKTDLMEMIWSQRFHRGGCERQLLMSPIFICIIQDSNIKRLTYPLNIKSKRFTVHPVFRVQKCSGISSVDSNGQNKCCAIFVDEYGRVYSNWSEFMKNCKYSDGIMVAPKMGMYNGSIETNEVLLDIAKRSSGVTKVIDNSSVAIGLASAVVSGVALIPTVTLAPVVVGVAVGAGVGSALYSGARSAYRLFDRKKHKQKIGITNREARGEWLNVGVGAVSVGAAGATQVLARAARNGRNISTIARNSVRLVNIAAVSVSASASADDTCSIIYRLYKHGSATKEQFAQLLFDLFLLKHSVDNFSAARQIMSISESVPVNEVLAKNQKKSFETLAYRTRELPGYIDAATKPLVRSLKKSLCDPKVGMDCVNVILKKAPNVGISIEDVIRNAFGIVAPPIVREYCREFDNILIKLIKFVERKLNIGNLNSISRPLTNWLRDVTFNCVNRMLDFVLQLIIEMGQSFEQVLKRLHINFKRRSAIQNTDLNSYISSKSDDELRATFNEERQKIENFEQIDRIDDEAYGAECDLDDERKLELVIEEYASKYTNEFMECSPATNTNELHEVIERILHKLSHEEANTFFTLAKQLIRENAENIQTYLGRFISVDIFIVEIYCLLNDYSCKLNYESLGEYLSKFDEIFKNSAYPIIENEFQKIYVLENDPSLKKVRCQTCGGEVFVSK